MHLGNARPVTYGSEKHECCTKSAVFVLLLYSFSWQSYDFWLDQATVRQPHRRLGECFPAFGAYGAEIQHVITFNGISSASGSTSFLSQAC